MAFTKAFSPSQFITTSSFTNFTEIVAILGGFQRWEWAIIIVKSVVTMKTFSSGREWIGI